MKKIYRNGTIRTMNEGQTVEAVLTVGTCITAAGNYDDILRLAPDAEQIDLKGHTMLPAFIDAHSHLSSYAMSFLQVPLEECRNFDEISQRVKNFIQTNQIRPGAWVIAKGYDHNALNEKKHPGIKLLDKIAPSNPLVLQHISGHVGVFNTQALKDLGVTEETPAPTGGRIGVENGKLTGYLEENAFISSLKKIPMHSPEDMVCAYRKAQEGYASHGITTVQEGMTIRQLLPLYGYLTAQKLLYLDTVAYLMPDDADDFFKMYPEAVRSYQNHFKLGGYKIMLDGSPQGRTAWMKTPYQNQQPSYFGYGTMSDETVRAAVKTAADTNLQLNSRQQPIAVSNGFNRSRRQSANGITEPINNTI